MAILREIKIALGIRGDGSATTFNFVLSGSPLWFRKPVDGDFLQANFSLSTLLPTDVKDVSTSPALTVSAASITTLGTVLSVTFSAAPAADTDYTVYGTLLF